ncbi:MAG: GH116 family glycosyl hydrolase [Planctomycetota bacterium]
MTSDRCCDDGACHPRLDRRQMLSAAGLAWAPRLRNQDPTPPQDRAVPADKKLDPKWLASLTARGERKVFRGEERRSIGMPCGGIAAGQLYVRGDGTLGWFWLQNDACNTGYGGRTKIKTALGEYPVAYTSETPPSPFAQGFALRVQRGGGEAAVRRLDDHGCADIGFVGEYPVATVRYEDEEDPLPVGVELEVFSPFVPLAAADSALPLTVLRFHLHNRGDACVATVAGWLENPVLRAAADRVAARLRNVCVQHAGITSVLFEPVADVAASDPRLVVFADFESGYGDWHKEGEAFGDAPATGTLPDQQEVSGFQGEGLVNTFRDGDKSTGRLRSPEFDIELPYIAFRIGGGNHPHRTCMDLVVDGKVVRTATGRDQERLVPMHWDVRALRGKRAHLEIVDDATGAWGHVNVDQIVFAGAPPEVEPLGRHPQWGDVALSAHGDAASACAHLGDADAVLAALHASARLAGPALAGFPLGSPGLGAVAQTVALAAGARATLTFTLTWCFPHRHQDAAGGVGSGAMVGADGQRVGNMYANWFRSALDVARHFAAHGERLVQGTFAFRDALYDTTLPYWFVQRVSAPLANLATETCQWWQDGRFWAFEGVGCCHGTCGHVWNYAQGLARLFPELERTVRERQDLAPEAGFDEKTGAVRFRGHPSWRLWAGDAQAGTVLKCYREHLVSADDAFLHRVWPHLKRVLDFLIEQDPDADGLIEGRQHNTYDIDFFGANTMVGSLYLAALRAGAAMSEILGDTRYAARLRAIAARGADASMQRLWNGEWFVQDVDLAQHGKDQYEDGCLSDQLFGQSWAHQLDLGFLYPESAVRSAMRAIWRHNWAPDVGPPNAAHKPERAFARPGEAGLLLCTWPKGDHPGDKGVRYRDEVWTGIEYQVAAEMLYEGMVQEGLAVVRAVHDRYDGSKHNPWNEIECGDHYARALASWGCLLGVSGFAYDGPAGRIGFAPRLGAGDFRAFFSAAEGFGTFSQRLETGALAARIGVRHGSLRLTQVDLSPPHVVAGVRVRLGGRELVARHAATDGRLHVVFDAVTLLAGDELEVRALV